MGIDVSKSFPMVSGGVGELDDGSKSFSWAGCRAYLTRSSVAVWGAEDNEANSSLGEKRGEAR